MDKNQFVPIQKLLHTEEIRGFLEVSIRAPHCPMPLNSDVWDGLRCGHACKYCFADSFRSSLYSSFYDNYKDMGYRFCNPDYFKTELDKLMKFRGTINYGSEVQRAIGMQIPIRLGIKFEDFLPIEGKKGISLEFLKYLTEIAYPVMINTKSDLIGREDYVKVLSDNKGKVAVHITMISSNDKLNKRLEPGAPSFEKRIKTAKVLTDAGIRVVTRIEPLMIFVNDNKEDVDHWISQAILAGIKNITLDTYSFSAFSPGIKRQMELAGVEFDRMFLLMSDSQWLGSLLLTYFMKYLRSYFYCSTFDFGNVPDNDQVICCEVGDWFPNAGYSYGNNLMAINYIRQREGKLSTWNEYDSWVDENGGWLSGNIRMSVWKAWNQQENLGMDAYFLDWARGIEPVGMDEFGNKIWRYNNLSDFREDNLKVLLKKV